MNIDQQAANLLLTIANEFDKTARQYQAVSYWLKSSYAPGLTLMVCAEAKERWEYSRKIYDHVCERGGTVSALPPIASIPATGQGWVTESVFTMLGQRDNTVLVNIKSVLGKLNSSGEQGCVKFLAQLESDFWKDVNETRKVINHTGQKVPTELFVLDKDYEKRYDGD